VAYGTSQLKGNPINGEFDLTLEEARACGLSKPTRFNTAYRDSMPNNLSHDVWVGRKGNIARAGDAAVLKLFNAGKAAGLFKNI
jgi:hypothetical protein